MLPCLAPFSRRQVHTYSIRKPPFVPPTSHYGANITADWRAIRGRGTGALCNPSFGTTFRLPLLDTAERPGRSQPPRGRQPSRLLPVRGRRARGAPRSSGRGQPSLPRGARPRHQTRHARPGPGRLRRWTPASGDGRGPRRPPPRRLGLQRRAGAPPAPPAPDLPAGESGAPGQRPRAWRAGADAAGARPRDPRVSPVGGQEGQRRQGAAAGQRGLWRGVAGTWLSPQHQATAAAILPSTPCRRRRRRRRRTPLQVSRMWAFPGVACAGPRTGGFGPPGRRGENVLPAASAFGSGPSRPGAAPPRCSRLPRRGRPWPWEPALPRASPLRPPSVCSPRGSAPSARGLTVPGLLAADTGDIRGAGKEGGFILALGTRVNS